jgi:hypothetical protein
MRRLPNPSGCFERQVFVWDAPFLPPPRSSCKKKPPFRRALRRSDQISLDDLFSNARQHLAAAQYASHALPFEVFLLSMLLEEHKEVVRLRQLLEEHLSRQP